MTGNGEDKGKNLVMVGDEKGQVFLRFEEPKLWLKMEPQNAFDIAEAIARAAHKARFGEAVASDANYLAGQVRARLTEDLRDRMVVRAALVMRDLIEKKQSPDYVARQVVDTIFAAVD